MPLKKLKTNKLQLVKKIYADDPEPNFIEMINNVNQNEIFSYEAESLEDSKHLLNPLYIEMNQTLAASYEEFEIIKIKKNGEKQLRILGINKFRIFNKYRERHEGGFFEFWVFLFEKIYRIIEFFKYFRI